MEEQWLSWVGCLVLRTNSTPFLVNSVQFTGRDHVFFTLSGNSRARYFAAEPNPTNMDTHQLRGRSFLVHTLACVALVFQACTGPDNAETDVKDQQELQAEEATTDKALETEFDARSLKIAEDFSQGLADLYPQPCIPVCRKEWGWLTDQYADNFKIEVANGYIEVPDPVISVPWKDFRNKVMSKTPFDRLRGVVFHFGLTPTYRFALGMNVVLMKAPLAGQPWTYDEAEGTFYIVKQGDIDPMDMTDWAPFEARYRDTVDVARTGNGSEFRELDNCDHLTYFMPWEMEIFHLGDHNKPPVEADVVFSCGAMPFTWPNDGNGNVCAFPASLRQTLILHLDGYLNNDKHVVPNEPILLGRGIDLGTPCPPRCGKWIAPSTPSTCDDRDRCAEL